MTPLSRCTQIAMAVVLGLFIGLAYAIGSIGLVVMVCVLGFSIARFFVPSLPEPSEWLENLAGVLAFGLLIGLPVWLAIRFALKTDREQLAEFRSVTNKCLHCGYSLTGIRRIKERCPECGEVFKKLP